MPRCRARSRGCYGGKILADYAKAQGWNVVANLNNDIIGNSCSSDGVCDDKHVRVFSEGPRWQGQEELAAQIRSLGGENDAPSRNISRFLDSLADRLEHRPRRAARSGATTASAAAATIPSSSTAAFPAVRLSVAVENYDWQHQDLRTENGIKYGDTIDHMDFPYLEKVTKLNVAALAAIASAPPPPEPKVEGAVSTDTTLTWVASVRQCRCIRRPLAPDRCSNWRGSDVQHGPIALIAAVQEPLADRWRQLAASGA